MSGVYFLGWGPYFLGWGDASPAPSAIPQGGAGYPVYVKAPKLKRLDQVVSEWMDADVRDMYAEIVAVAPKAIKREAAKIVRPFAAKPRAQVPAAETVDWKAVHADAARVMKLLRIWQEQEADMEAEEELLLLMH